MNLPFVSYQNPPSPMPLPVTVANDTCRVLFEWAKIPLPASFAIKPLRKTRCYGKVPRCSIKNLVVLSSALFNGV